MAKITLVNYASGDKWIPLGCLQILTALRNEGFQVKFIDLQTIEDGINKFDSFSDDSEYLLISTLSMMLPWLFRAIKTIKNKNPKKKIILGGPGVSPISEEILKCIKSVDYVIEGEGETAIVELIKTLENKNSSENLVNICNLTYIENDKIIKNKRVKQNEDETRIADRTNINKNDYDIVSSVITSYGCPYNCGFCYNRSMWCGKVQLKPLRHIFNEIDYILKKYDLNHIVFVDDLFFLLKQRCYEFFDLYKSGKYNFKYAILGSRIDSLDDDMLMNLKDTNCVSLSFGIESASNKILKKINKNITIEKALETLDRARKYVSDISPSFIVGFPFESLEEFHGTIDTAMKLYNSGLSVVMSFLRPQVGTEIYKEYKDDLFPDFRGIIRPFEMDDQIKEIVKENSTLYSWFYTYKTPELEEKIRTYREINMKYIPIQKRLMNMGVK